MITLWQNEAGPESAPTLVRPLNRLLDYTERGLAVKATQACSVVGCDTRARARGWCNSHYERWRKTGSVGDAPIRHFRTERERCSVVGCDRPYKAAGFCDLHWKRNDKHGNPHHVEVQTLKAGANAWKADVTYAGAHRRLERYRGRAVGQACVDCAGPAHQWAYDHADPDERTELVGGYRVPFSVNPDHYRPMCRSCHKRFDLGRHG